MFIRRYNHDKSPIYDLNIYMLSSLPAFCLLSYRLCVSEYQAVRPVCSTVTCPLRYANTTSDRSAKFLLSRHASLTKRIYPGELPLRSHKQNWSPSLPNWVICRSLEARFNCCPRKRHPPIPYHQPCCSLRSWQILHSSSPLVLRFPFFMIHRVQSNGAVTARQV